MGASQTRIKGFKELDAELKLLPLKMQGIIIPRVIRAGANIVLADARAKAPVRGDEDNLWPAKDRPAGFLKSKDGIAVNPAYGRWKKIARVTDIVGITKEAFYGRFIEFGWDWTFPPGKKKGGRVKKHIRRQPFLRPALDRNKSKIISAMRKKFGSQIRSYKKGTGFFGKFDPR